MNTSVSTHANTETPAATTSSRRSGNSAGEALLLPVSPAQPASVAHRGRLKALTPAKLRRIWYTSIPADKIGAVFGVTGRAVLARADALGFPRRGNDKIAFADAESFSEMWLAGVVTSEIAQHFGYTHKSSVSKRAHNLGLPPRKRVKGAGKNTGTGRAGWGGVISLDQFFEQQLGRLMAESNKESDHV